MSDTTPTGASTANDSPVIESDPVSKRHADDWASSTVRLFLRKPVSVLMVLVAVFVVGTVAYSRIPVQQWPAGLEIPVMVVSLSFRNADSAVSPAEVEEELTKPVEEMLSSVPGLSSINSRTSPQSARIIMMFDSGTPMDVTYAEVKDRIDRVRSQIDDELNPPMIWTVNPDDEPILEYGLAWAPDLEPATAFSRIDNEVIPAIEGVPGVAQVEIAGALETYFEIDLRPDDLGRLGVNPFVLSERLRQDNFTLSAGQIEDANRQYFVVADARLQTAEDLKQLPISGTARLDDVGTVEELSAFRNNEIVYLNGRPAVRLEVRKSAEGNTVEVSRRVNALLREMIRSGQLDGFYLTPLDDQGEKIGNSVNSLLETAFSGGIWAFVILFAFLRRARLTLLIMLNTPLSLLIGLVVMYFMGESINLLTLMGFTLVVGMLVDNAVVVTESVARFREMGENRENASAHGTGEVMLAVTLATATTIVVFLPLMLMSGSELLTFFLTKIGIPLIVSLSASLFTAVVFIPLAAKGLAGQHRFNPREVGLLRVMKVVGALAIATLILVPTLGLYIPEVGVALGMSGEDGGGLETGLSIGAMAAGALVLLGFLAWAAYPLAEPADRAMGWVIDQMRAGYLWLLEKSLTHRLATVGSVVFVLIFTWMVGFATPKDNGSIGEIAESARTALGVKSIGFSERPSSKPDSVRLWVSFPPSYSLGQADAVMREYNAIIDGLYTAEAALAALPADVDESYMRARFGTKLQYDAAAQTLVWRGVKNDAELSAVVALSADPEWRRVVTGMVETARAAKPEIPYYAHSTRFSSSNGRIMLYLDPDDPSWNEREVGEKLVKMLPTHAGVVPRFGWGGGGGGGGFGEQRVTVMVQGPDTSTLMGLAKEVERRLTLVPGLADVAVDVEEGREEMQVRINRDLAVQQGANPSTITRSIAFALNGTNLGDIQLPDGRRQSLRMRMEPTYEYDAVRDRITTRPEDLQGLMNLGVPVSAPAAAANAGANDVTANRNAVPGVDRPDDGRSSDDFGFESMVDANGNRISGGAATTGASFATDRAAADARLFDEAASGNRFARSRQSADGGASMIGGVVPFKTFVIDAPQVRQGLGEVRRTDQQSTLEVTAAVDRNANMEDIGDSIESALASMAMPSGYRWQFGEQMRRRNTFSGEQMPFALLTAMFCVFALMAVFFESVFKPFAILITVPLAFIGATWAWIFSETPIDVVVVVGVVILVGLVVNNGIVLVDLINRHVARGMPRRQAIIEAGKYRFRPILMTALTTIVGLIPMAQGAGTFVGVPYFPIARTVIGGLISSTALTLLVIPVFYSLIDDFARDVKNIWRLSLDTLRGGGGGKNPPTA